MLEQLLTAWTSVLQFAPPHVPSPFQGDGGDLCSGEELAALLRQLGVAWSDARLVEVLRHIGQAPDKARMRSVIRDGLLGADGMVDAFRSLYPDAEGRFSTWGLPARRSRNEGSLVDHFLIGKELEPCVRVGAGLRCGCDKPHRGGQRGLEAAFCAATCRRSDAQFGPPHTGLVYTPHLCSDHVPVTLLLDEAALLRVAERLHRGAAAGDAAPLTDAVPLADRIKLALRSCELSRDARTAEAQPHKQRQQQLLTGFFPAAAAQPHVAAEGSKRRRRGA